MEAVHVGGGRNDPANSIVTETAIRAWQHEQGKFCRVVEVFAKCTAIVERELDSLMNIALILRVCTLMAPHCRLSAARPYCAPIAEANS